MDKYKKSMNKRRIRIEIEGNVIEIKYSLINVNTAVMCSFNVSVTYR